MTAISKLQFSPFRANFCRGWAKPLIYDIKFNGRICRRGGGEYANGYQMTFHLFAQIFVAAGQNHSYRY